MLDIERSELTDLNRREIFCKELQAVIVDRLKLCACFSSMQNNTNDFASCTEMTLHFVFFSFFFSFAREESHEKIRSRDYMYYPGYKECYESLEKILLLCFLTISWRYKGAIVESTREFDNRVVYNEQREKLSFFEKSSFFFPRIVRLHDCV